MKRKLVQKITEDIDPATVYATTYQMRNFYAQFKDGFFSNLDVMNYIQHHKAVKMMKKGDRVLDVCCGRGLLLPLIRYYAKDIKEYVGVDIFPANINAQKRISGVKPIDNSNEYYPFKHTMLISSCEDMDKQLEGNSFDLIVYTSAIEHMQKEVGVNSLKNCFNLIKKGTGILFLSCPNTMDKKDPYDCQYDAHLYEWSLEELTIELKKLGFRIDNQFGLVVKKRKLMNFIQENPESEAAFLYKAFKDYLPNEWLSPLVSINNPELADEVLLICSRPKKGRLLR